MRVIEKFEGAEGKLWKSGAKGTATMFSSWVRMILNENTVNNSLVKTCRDSVLNEGQYETLRMSFGKKDILPLDIFVKVPQQGESIISLKYRPEPKAAKWAVRDYKIKDPNALSVDPTTKKLVSVVFKGSQFSFAGVKGRLSNIPGYEEALNELVRPFRQAAKIAEDYDKEAYKSRNVRDFDSLPQLEEIKDLYKDWEVDTDTSKIASQNKVTYRFTHPSDPDYNFEVSIRDEGGSEYRIMATFRGVEMNLENLYKNLRKEIDRLEDSQNKYSEYESKEIKKEMKLSGSSNLSFLNDKTKLDSFIKKLSEAIGDFSLNRVAVVDITQNDDGSEDWELILKTQHAEKSIFWHTAPNGKVESFDTNFGYDSTLSGVPQISPNFFQEVTKACEEFLSEYGAYNRNLATVDVIRNDWVKSYNKPDYDLANWADRVLYDIEPELESLQEKYNLSLERVYNNPESSSQFDRDRTGKILFSGSYLDTNFNDHLLELRVNFDRGDKFIVWIRPDLKGTAKDKAEGQSDLSFFEEWVKENVSLRSSKKDSSSFKKAIEQELLKLGAIEGSIRGTLEITTTNFKSLLIDLKVTNGKVIVNAYNNGKVIEKIEFSIQPFEEPPVKVAKRILSSISKITKESFPSVDRLLPVVRDYWNSLSGENLAFEGNTLRYGSRRCLVEMSSLGILVFKTLTGSFITEEQFNVDNRYKKQDKEDLYRLLEQHRNWF